MSFVRFFNWLRPKSEVAVACEPARDLDNWRLARLFKVSDDYIDFAPFSCPLFHLLECPLCGEISRMEEVLVVQDRQLFLCSNCCTHVRFEPSDEMRMATSSRPVDEFALRRYFEREADLFGLVEWVAQGLQGCPGGRFLHIGNDTDIVLDFVRSLGGWSTEGGGERYASEALRKWPAHRSTQEAVPSKEQRGEQGYDAIFCDVLGEFDGLHAGRLRSLIEGLSGQGRLCLLLPHANEIYRENNNARIAKFLDIERNSLVASEVGIKRLFERIGLKAPTVLATGRKLCVVIDQGEKSVEPIGRSVALDMAESYLSKTQGDFFSTALAIGLFMEASDVGDHATSLRFRPFLTNLLRDGERASLVPEAAFEIEQHPALPRLFFADAMLQLNGTGQTANAAKQFRRAREAALVAFTSWPDIFPGEEELAQCAWVHEVLALLRLGEVQQAKNVATLAANADLSSQWSERLGDILRDYDLFEAISLMPRRAE